MFKKVALSQSFSESCFLFTSHYFISLSFAYYFFVCKRFWLLPSLGTELLGAKSNNESYNVYHYFYYFMQTAKSAFQPFIDHLWLDTEVMLIVKCWYLFPGEQISRKYGYVRVMYVRDDCSVTISSHIPELHYTFNANFTNNWKGRMFEFTVAEVLKRYGSAVSAFVFKVLIQQRSS